MIIIKERTKGSRNYSDRERVEEYIVYNMRGGYISEAFRLHYYND